MAYERQQKFKYTTHDRIDLLSHISAAMQIGVGIEARTVAGPKGLSVELILSEPPEYVLLGHLLRDLTEAAGAEAEEVL